MSNAQARLEVVGGKAAGQSLLVTDELIIGRFVEGPGQLGGDDEISRSHARLSVDAAGSWTMEDLGSTNGTYINGLRISAPQTLSEGDTIELGGTTLVVQELAAPAARDITAPHSVPPPEPTPVAPPPVVEAPPPLESSSVPPPPAVEAPLPPPDLSPVPSPPPPADAEAADEAVAPLLLNVHIDVEAREALLTVGDSETVRLVFENGQWRVAASP